MEVTASGYFKISGEGITSETGFSTFVQATQEIDRLVAAKRAKSRKLNLTVIDGSGKVGILTGLHLGTSQVTTTGCDDSYILPDVPWVVDTIRDKLVLQRQIAKLQEKLNPFVLKSRFGYGRLSPEEYGELLNKVEEEYAKKLAEATAAGG